MSWVVALLAFAQVGLWRRQRRLERENAARTVALTRFLNAQLDLDAANARARAAIPGLVEAEVRRAIERDAVHAFPLSRN